MRYISWFSCGIPSALTAKYAVDDYDADVVYCDTFAEEHPDNIRFLEDCQEWIGTKIKIIKSNDFSSPTEVFKHRRFMSSPKGAPCTGILKRMVRHQFQNIDDVHIWGFYVGEERRAYGDSKTIGIVQAEPEFEHKFPLLERGLTKTDCHEIFTKTGIKIPKMYELGYDNNNCIGCVKATSPKYWNMIRKDFPKEFKARSELSRDIGCKLVRVGGKRIYLDELDPNIQESLFEHIECGVICQNG